MMFAKKCPKCGGNVQTKVIKKTIGLGTVDIPVSQFCLNPSCDWYQDFAEAKKPEDIKENVLQIGLPNIDKLSEIKKPGITSKHIIALGGVVVVVLIVLIISSIMQAGQPGKTSLATQTPVSDAITPEITSIPSASQTPISTSAPLKADPKTYPVKIDASHGFYPAVLTINRSDTVRWNNVENQRPRIVLMSNDGLFEDWKSQEPDSFSYQFNESGDYTFVIAEYPSLKVYPNTTGRVIVK